MSSVSFLDTLKSHHIPAKQEVSLLKKDASLFEREVCGVISPTSQEEVYRIVKLAKEQGVSLYPISGGKNWGYGTALPVADSAWILDLSGLSRIVHYDADQMAITIEPGVTQAMLDRYLMDHGIDAMTPNTGIGAHGNILGNILERGFGVAPLQDHASSLMSLKACLANGQEFQSFFRGLPQALDAGYKWGLGPSLEPLFFQSGLGIVTEATIKLMKRPKHIELAVLSIDDDHQLRHAIQYGRELNSEFPGQVQAFKVFDAPQVKKTLGNESDRLLGVKVASARICIAVLYSNPVQIRSLRKSVTRTASRNRLRGIKFFSRAKINRLRKSLTRWPLSALLKDQARPLESLHEYMRLAEGHPSSLGLNLLYPDLDNKSLETVNPAHDEKGIIWYAPIVPMKPELLLKAMTHISALSEKRGLPKPSMTITCVSEATAAITVPLLFDRQTRDNAYGLYRELLQLGAQEGFFPYRIPIEFMKDLLQFHPDYWNHVRSLQQALDPKQTLASGRYNPA